MIGSCRGIPAYPPMIVLTRLGAVPSGMPPPSVPGSGST